MKKPIFYLSILLISFVLLSVKGCAVQDWGSMSQAYRDFVSYYNGYFNARDILEQGKNDLKENHEDNFDNILEVYRLADEDAARGISSQMETVEEKATRVIQGYENSNWVDDSYLLIGRARLYKRDYREALESFRHISSNFRETVPGQEAMIWTIITNTQMERYNEARSMVSVVNSRDTFPEPLKKDYYLAVADLEIKRQNFAQAIDALEEAIDRISGQRAKSRYQFILGQLHERRGNIVKANEFFDKAANRPETYELGFQANLNKALTMEVTNLNQYQDKKEVLEDMVGDDKNEPYLDQLYYELAKLELFIEDYEEARNLLRKSIQYNQDNNIQKKKTLSLLGELNYDKERYLDSYSQYNELVSLFEQNEEAFPGRDTMENKAIAFRQITENHKTIQVQDSLQRLGRLEEDELISRLEEVIEQREEEDLLAEGAGEEIEQDFEQPDEIQEGDWYFYNPTALSSGVQQFQSRFGDRPRVDNWRFASKMEREEREEAPEEPAPEGVEAGEEEPDHQEKLQNLLAEVPRSDAQRNASDNLIMEAYFNLGYAYHDRLKQDEKAIKMLESLQEKFPDNRFSAQAYYVLHEAHLSLGNTAKAEEYSNILHENYPNSDYTAMIQEPEAFRERLAGEQRNEKLESLFNEAYDAFREHQCETVEEKREAAQTSADITNNYLEANFQYLSLLCNLRNDTSRQNRVRLEDFSNEHEGTEMARHAQNILSYLETGKKSESEPEYDISMFSSNRNETHFYAFAFDLNDGDSREIREAFSSFNQDFESDERLRIQDMMLAENTQVINVRAFDNQSSAKHYLDEVEENPYFLPSLDMEKDSWEHFVITETNFRELINNQNKEAYLAFYQQYYK